MTNQNQKTEIRILYIMNKLYTGCYTKEAVSLLLLRSTKNFKKNWLLHMHFRLIVSNQNQKTTTRTLYILKMLYKECSTKEAIKLVPSRSTWNFQNKWLLHIYFRLIVSNQNQKTRIRTFYILKILYIECSTKDAISLLLSRSA